LTRERRYAYDETKQGSSMLDFAIQNRIESDLRLFIEEVAVVTR
jgi:hypothetical protein